MVPSQSEQSSRGQSEVVNARDPLSCRLIGIEITERSTIDQKASAEALGRLKRAGHPIYLDDFGTSYSSLAYLHLLATFAVAIGRAHMLQMRAAHHRGHPADEVLALSMLQPDQVTDASHNNHRVRSVDVGRSGSTPVP